MDKRKKLPSTGLHFQQGCVRLRWNVSRILYKFKVSHLPPSTVNRGSLSSRCIGDDSMNLQVMSLPVIVINGPSHSYNS